MAELIYPSLYRIVVPRWFATGETIAHLRYLEEKSLIARVGSSDHILYRSEGSERL